MSLNNKLAFLFLTIENSECNFIWDDFFLNVPKNQYKIFTHPKFPNLVNDFLKPHILPETIETLWGDKSLVQATLLLLKYAFNSDKNISHFILLSHNTAPLISFNSIYTQLQNYEKGYIEIIKNRKDRGPYHLQWVILPRILVKEALSNSYLLFLLFKLYENLAKTKPCIFDEQWLDFLIHGLLKKEYSDFFINTENNKVYQNFIVFNDLPNKQFYKEYSDKYNNKQLDWRYSAHSKFKVPYIYTLEEYFNIREKLVKENYFFIRKVIGEKLKYDDIKNRMGINNLFK